MTWRVRDEEGQKGGEEEERQGMEGGRERKPRQRMEGEREQRLVFRTQESNVLCVLCLGEREQRLVLRPEPLS